MLRERLRLWQRIVEVVTPAKVGVQKSSAYLDSGFSRE
jgi:hypothetical protein